MLLRHAGEYSSRWHKKKLWNYRYIIEALSHSLGAEHLHHGESKTMAVGAASLEGQQMGDGPMGAELLLDGCEV